jgi:taurine dioxygenase
VFGVQARNGDEMQSRLGNAEAATQDAVHAVVITHPISGKKALYVNRGFTTHIEGWTPEESKPLLEYLYQHGGQEKFCYRFSWARGSVAFWDNRATWHLAVNDYHGHRRLLHRITLEGEPLM